MSVFLLVPGARRGGWCWKYVASDLCAMDHTAVPATLTGLDEQAHLLSRDIGLETHISDIVGLFEYRDVCRVAENTRKVLVPPAERRRDSIVITKLTLARSPSRETRAVVPVCPVHGYLRRMMA